MQQCGQDAGQTPLLEGVTPRLSCDPPPLLSGTQWVSVPQNGGRPCPVLPSQYHLVQATIAPHWGVREFRTMYWAGTISSREYTSIAARSLGRSASRSSGDCT